MDYQENNKKFWDEHFSKVSLDYPNEEVIRFLARCRKIYPNGVMLDWGCATGCHTILGCKFGYSVIAADYVQRCVDITKNKVEKECKDYAGKVISYIVNQDVDIDGIEDNTVDVIVALGVIFLNSKEQQQIMLNNMYRMLKKGGRIFVDFRTERDSIYINQKKKSEEGFVVDYEDASIAGNYIDILPYEELEKMFEKSGLKVENVELYEFTEHNRTRQNSWWHVTLLKE